MLTTMQNFPLLNLPDSLAFVCHDAGAANHIFAWMRTQLAAQPNAKQYWRLLALGPAAKLWDECDLPQVCLCQTIDDALNGAEVIITGTGWASDHEYNAINLARQRSIKSIAVVDHWTNYRARFVRNKVECAPDEIWVTDEYAKKLAEDEFENIDIFQMPNDYLENLAQEIRMIDNENGAANNLLYVMEPIRNGWGDGVVDGEFEALGFFVKNLGELGLKGNLSIRLRPHPSDPFGKYDKWLKEQIPLKITLDKSKALSDSIAWSNIVIGCQTYAMVVALEVGKKVYCSLPTRAPDCALPQNNIIRLSELIR
jgi:hypothetical protein